MNYKDLKIVTFIPGSRGSIRSDTLSDNEVFCGPDCEIFKKNQSFKRLKTVLGYYDAKEIIEKTFVGNSPDLIVVKTDSYIRNMPENLIYFKCPKVLIVEDTKSDFFTSKDLLHYAMREGFDFITSETNRRELEFFKDAGFKKVFWSPALNLKRNNAFFRINKQKSIAHKETPGLDTMENLPLVRISNPNDFELHLINLVSTEGYRLNEELFYCLENGGLLLTDDKAKNAGLSLLFSEGKHYRSYQSADELNTLLKDYLLEPDKALKIARDSFNEFEKKLSFDLCRKRFLSFIFSDIIDQTYLI